MGKPIVCKINEKRVVFRAKREGLTNRYGYLRSVAVFFVFELKMQERLIESSVRTEQIRSDQSGCLVGYDIIKGRLGLAPMKIAPSL